MTQLGALLWAKIRVARNLNRLRAARVQAQSGGRVRRGRAVVDRRLLRILPGISLAARIRHRPKERHAGARRHHHGAAPVGILLGSVLHAIFLQRVYCLLDALPLPGSGLPLSSARTRSGVVSGSIRGMCLFQFLGQRFSSVPHSFLPTASPPKRRSAFTSRRWLSMFPT